jgi:hypothetical protein
MDTRIAQEIFRHEVWASNKVVHEKTALGKRPLRRYTKEIEAAWEVAERMKISVIPVADGHWFAFSHAEQSWASPQDFADFLAKGDFRDCGAAIGAEAPQVICEAALRMLDKRAALGAEAAVLQ